MNDLPIELLSRLADTLKLLAHPQRLKIVEILQREEEAPVHALTEQLGLAQAATSHHLNSTVRNRENDGRSVKQQASPRLPTPAQFAVYVVSIALAISCWMASAASAGDAASRIGRPTTR